MLGRYLAHEAVLVGVEVVDSSKAFKIEVFAFTNSLSSFLSSEGPSNSNNKSSALCAFVEVIGAKCSSKSGVGSLFDMSSTTLFFYKTIFILQ